MQLFTASQIRQIDAVTIEKEPLTSVDLMERAAEALFEAFVERYEYDAVVYVFAGNGNNGGDALALARLLSRLKSCFDVRVFVFETEKRSPDCEKNLDRLGDLSLNVLESSIDFPVFESEGIIVDGIFGTGLSRKVEGFAADLIDYINKSGLEVFSIDIPSGMFAESNACNDGAIIRSDVVISFQFPKFSFLFSDKADCIDEWEVWDIALHQETIDAMESPYYLLQEDYIESLLKSRSRFSHKGTYGKALLIAGKNGMMGAAILATKACLRSGVGLVTTHVPEHSGALLQTTVPEALLSIDRSELMFTDEVGGVGFDAVAVGPGIGIRKNTREALRYLLQHCDKPLVIDADGLNILSEHKEWFEFLPENSILTPHPKEFDRLTHEHSSAYERWQSQLDFAQSNNVIVVLKGAHTSIAMPDGRCFFNSTGNSGMATGGSGDVLTGIILGLLAQGYSPEAAGLIGVYWHGKAADIYVEKYLEQTLIASDIIDCMGKW